MEDYVEDIPVETRRDRGPFKLFPKQQLCIDYLTLPQFDDSFLICYAGSIRSCKTYTACAWIMQQASTYPGVRIAVIRKSRNLLERDFIGGMDEVFMDLYGDAEKTYSVVRGTNVIITFSNGSTVVLMGMDQGRDQNFQRIRGWSGAFAVIDELQEQDSEDIISAISGRLSQAGSFINPRSGKPVAPKILALSNPAPPEHFVYQTLYAPAIKHGNLPASKRFILAYPTDNETLDAKWHQMQKAIMTPDDLAIVYGGNWDHCTSNDHLFDDRSLSRAFGAEPKAKDSRMYCTVDVATDSGKDSSCVSVWRDWDCIRVITLHGANAAQLIQQVREMQGAYRIPNNRVICDANGVGYGIAQQLDCVAFLSSASPLNAEPYQHLKAQCFYRLAKKINEGECTFQDIPPKEQGLIMEELLAYRSVNRYKESKNQISPKSEVRTRLNRSPDRADSLAMRSWFDFSDDEFIIDW